MKKIRRLTKIRRINTDAGWSLTGEKPKPYRPTRPTKISLPRFDSPGVYFRRGWVIKSDQRYELEQRADQTIRGSLHERILYAEFKRRGIHVDYQFKVESGKRTVGSVFIDFYVPQYNAIVEVLGSIWHGSYASRQRDAWRMELIADWGFTLYELWDWQIEDREFLEDWFDRHFTHYVPQLRDGGGWHPPQIIDYTGVKHG